MKLMYELKCEITDEDKLGVYIYAYHRKFILAVILLMLAGIVGVAATFLYGWIYGFVAFMSSYAVILMIADRMFTVFMNRAIDKVVRQKISEQCGSIIK